jgi:formiminotetrahydrofolate cyclodeaminase
MGAMGAALISMVCNLTLGKEKHADVADEMQAILAEAEAVRTALTLTIAEDIRAFDAVIAAYGLPKDTEDQKLARSAGIQAALKLATEAPLACARLAARVIALSGAVAEKGNPNVVSDAGVAVMAAWASLKSAALNVYVNAAIIRDREFAQQRLNELASLVETAGAAVEPIYSAVCGRL